MNFVDEKDLAVLYVCKDAGEVKLLLQNGAGGLVEFDVEFGGDDGGKRGLTKAGGTVEQDVVHVLTAMFGGFYSDGEILFELGLAREVLEAAGAQAGFKLCIFGFGGGGNYA